MTQKKEPDSVPRPMSDLHIAVLTAAELASKNKSSAVPDRFTPDQVSEAKAWENAPTRNTSVMPAVPDTPSLVPTDPSSGAVATEIKDEVTRPTSTIELVEAVDAGRITTSAALEHMTHRGRRKK